MKKTYSLVTFHFGDTRWINLWINKILSFSDERVKKIYIVNQNRSGNSEFTFTDKRLFSIEFEKDEHQIEQIGHDHAASIDKAIRQILFDTSHIILFDSDCFPVRSDWLDTVDEIESPILAADTVKWGLTHPCFMVFSKSEGELLDFSESLTEIGIDTGRLVGSQFVRQGVIPRITRAEKAFKGKRGDFYLNKSIYHHGSASISCSESNYISIKAKQIEENIYYSRILNSKFKLSFWEMITLFQLRTANKVASKIHTLGLSKIKIFKKAKL